MLHICYVPCAAITLWINISVKRHKWHRKINPINIIFLGFFLLFLSHAVVQYWEVGKRQIGKKRDWIGQNFCTKSLPNQKKTSTAYSKTLMAMRLLWANATSLKLDTHIFRLFYNFNTKICAIPLDFVTIRNVDTDQQKFANRKRESSSQFFKHAHTTFQTAQKFAFLSYTAWLTLHKSLFSHTGIVAYTHTFLWRRERKLLSLHLFLCRRGRAKRE